MNIAAPENSPPIRLARVLASGRLPPAAVKKGKRLLARINSPVRITIMGLPGSGKSSLLNMLAGQNLIPDDQKLPCLQASWGETSEIILTLNDGGTQSHPGVDLSVIATENAAFIELKVEATVLKKISLLEVVADGSTTDQCAAIDWACTRADIAIWCSQEFDQQEQKLWSRVPDALKDHSFFVLSKADALSAENLLSTRIADIQKTTGDEFYGVFPVATLQAINARRPDGSTDDMLLNASGGMALIKAIDRKVDQGRNVDTDGILLFLSRYDPAETKNNPIKKTNQRRGKSTGQGKPNGVAKPGKIVSARAVLQEKPVRTTADLNNSALDLLQERANALWGSAPDEGLIDAEQALDHCAATADLLVEIYSDGTAPEAAVIDIQDDMLDAAELILLMKLESGGPAAADAVTVLLQLRRDLEDNIAA